MPDNHYHSRQTYLTLIQTDNRLGKFNYEDEVLGHHYFIARDPRAIEAVHQIYKDGIMNGKTGKLSDNKLRDAKILFIVSVTLVTRYCIEAGMLQELAFTLSDLWIRHIENINSIEKLVEDQLKMVTEFYERLCSFKYVKSQNPYVTQAIHYIVQNLDQNLNARTVSAAVHLSSSYLTKLFYEDIGESIHSFVKKQRIEAAKEMLKYTHYSYAEIASSLNFSSQSYFISQFRASLGMTPKEYRKKMKMEHSS